MLPVLDGARQPSRPPAVPRVDLIWLAIAHALCISLFGYRHLGRSRNLSAMCANDAGRLDADAAGNGIGFLFAVLVLTISVVSFPLLLDRAVGAAAAIETSVRAVLANPLTMAIYGLARGRDAGAR